MDTTEPRNPWAAIRQPECRTRCYNVAAAGMRFLGFPCDRKVHAQLLADMVGWILPDGPPDGIMPNGTLNRCLVLRESFERFARYDSSRSIGAAREAWNEHVYATTVWGRVSGTGKAFECIRATERMGDEWKPVIMQPAIFGDIPAVRGDV